jgi:hypothetical protein
MWVYKCKTCHILWDYECNTCLGLTWENTDGTNGQTWGKNSISTFVLTAFIFFGLFNIFGRSKKKDAPAEKECNKCDLSATQFFWLAHHIDWSMWFAISSPPPICCPSFIGGVAEEYITKLGCEKYWAQLHML